MATDDTAFRTRLVLVMPARSGPSECAVLEQALAGGDIASVILYGSGENDDAARTESAAAVCAIAQPKDVAVLVSDDSRIAGRSGADGVHIEGGIEAVGDAIDRLSAKGLIVGAGMMLDRHTAMRAGEAGADYVFFGRLDREETEEAHPKTVALAEWWASLFEPPVIALAGSTPQSAEALARLGVDFVAVRSAVLAADDPAAAVADLNRRFERAAQERAALLSGSAKA